jgi:hypothetical protein
MEREDILNKVRDIPLLGPLIDCDGSDHWESLGQTLVILLLSTTPIWLATLVIFGTGTEMSYAALWAALYNTITDGQLFMYCTALLAPIFWIALVDPPGARVFPSKVSHMLLIGIIDIIASVFFGLTLAGKHVNPVFNFRLSKYMFFTSVILLYLGTVYHTSRMPDVIGEFKKQENDFSNTYQGRPHEQ